jgi:EXS family
VTRGSPPAVRAWEVLPTGYLVVVLAVLLAPTPTPRFFSSLVAGSGRARFRAAARRVALGGIALPQHGRFADVLLADALTSYAKVFGDLFVALCMVFSRVRSSSAAAAAAASLDRSCGGTLVVPLILAAPSAIRLRQCLIEYRRTAWAVRKADEAPVAAAAGEARAHLANALKYASAFPVILLSALQRGHDSTTPYVGGMALFRLW